MRDALIGVLILIASCSRSTQVIPAPTDADSAPPVASPSGGERPPPPAKKLVLAEEKPGDASVALANPVVVVGTVKAVDGVPRCDCEKAKLVVDRILRNDAALRLEEGEPMEVSLPGDELSSLLDKPRTWILRPEPGSSTRFSGAHHAPPSATAEIESALSDLAIVYERDDGPLPSFALVTQKSGAVVWHRHGRVAVKSQLTSAEARAQKRILEGFQTTSAAETPTPALATHQPWRLRVEGSGEQGDVKQTEQAVASFAEAVHARLFAERTVWQCSALVRGSLSQQNERTLLRIDRVLHGRDATVEVGRDLEVAGSPLTTPAPKLFALTRVHDGRAAVLQAFPSADEAELERLVAAQQQDKLFAR